MAETANYGLDLLDHLEQTPTARILADGDTVIRQHDRGSDVFVVLEGTLEASIESNGATAVVGRFERGQLFGELTAIAGGSRTATVRAAGRASVAVVPRADFVAWLDASPDVADDVAGRARDRVDRNRAAVLLATILGSDNREILGALLPMVRWRALEPGEVLCSEGDASDSAYLVLSGRLAVSSSTRVDRPTIELGRNTIVGELGVLDRLPRTATITATRRTRLAELPATAVDRIVSSHPEVAVTLLRQALARARRGEPRSDRAGVVALASAGTASLDPIVATLRGELERRGSVIVVDSRAIDAHLGPAGVAQSQPESVGASRVDALLHDYETTHDYVVLVADPSASPWTARAAEAADRTMVVMPAAPTAAELETVAAIDGELRSRRVPWWRLILHPTGSTNPAEHHPACADAERVLHARRGEQGDIRRAARLLTGNAVGLALGGGGARGFGHVGAYRALLEAGIEPDVVVGASIGSVFGAAIALDYTPAELVRLATDAFADLLDWTVPIVSFLKGARITGNIEDAFGGYRCEALWRPFSCVVTNLTRSATEVRQSGSLARAIRTSVSIPGVLPPLADGGEVYVDGGVLNNLPADVVAADPAVRTVFAIDVSPPLGPTAESAIGASISGFAALAARARGRNARHPTAAAIVMQTMVSGAQRDRRALLEAGAIDHYLHLDIQGSSLLAFDKVAPVIDQGYRSATTLLGQAFPEGYRPR